MATSSPQGDSKNEVGPPQRQVEQNNSSSLEFITDDESTGQRPRPECKDKLAQVDFNVEKIISKNKTEAMFELRKLSHQQHPVSAFSSKQSLENLVAKHSSIKPPPHQETTEDVTTPMCAHDQQPDTAGAEAPSLNLSERVQRLEPHDHEVATNLTPNHIQLEMQQLAELQIVNGILQGPVQEEIDRTLREEVERRRTRRRQRVRPPPPRVPRAEDSEEGGDEMSHPSGPPVGRLLSSGRGGNFRGPSARGRRVRFRPQPPTPNVDGRYPVPRRNQNVIVERLRQSPALNSLGDEARDEIVAEVSGLVSQQLVTSALSGEFRGVLELHIQSRADQISRGQVGPLISPPHYDHREDERETSSSASSRQIQELHEEMTIMKGQLGELKQMMKVSFDLQLDIQRAIRQEVAAALTAFLTTQPSPVASGGAANTCPIPTLGASQESGLSSIAVSGRISIVESGHCVICSEGVIDSVIYHCGHMCTCIACGLELKSKALKCPICRAPITDVIRTYTSMLQS